MSVKKNEDKYRKIDENAHVLLRSGMYIGSTKLDVYNRFIINDSNKMEFSEINYTPAYLKVFDEILINSVDESKRKGSKLNTIKVNIKGDMISVYDNGGIPVQKHKEYGEWIPEMIFSNLRAGSNFDDNEDRTLAGLNGIGSVATNIFSKEFNVETCDGKKMFNQTFSDNMTKRTKVVIKSHTKAHTNISYTSDFPRFNMTKLDDTHYNLIKKRVYDVAGCNPNLKIYFNDTLINIKKFEDYTKFYIDEVIYDENKNWQIGVGLADNGYKQVSFVNSNETTDGGTHVDYILNQIIGEIRTYINKKFKTDIKPSEIKNHIFFFLNSTIINPSFSSQTKEKLITESKEFGSTYVVPQTFINKILKSEIVNSISDWIDRKKEADSNKDIRKLNSSLKNIKVDKLLDAKSKFRDKCTLYLMEGECLEENTKVKIFRDSVHTELPIKDVNVGDLIITHNNNIQPIYSKINNIKQKCIIKSKYDDIICSKNHKFLVYDTTTFNFEFIETVNLDKSKHKLLKSKLNEVDTFFKIKDINVINDEYTLTLYNTIDSLNVIIKSGSMINVLESETFKYTRINIEDLNVDKHLVFNLPQT